MSGGYRVKKGFFSRSVEIYGDTPEDREQAKRELEEDMRRAAILADMPLLVFIVAIASFWAFVTRPFRNNKDREDKK